MNISFENKGGLNRENKPAKKNYNDSESTVLKLFWR